LAFGCPINIHIIGLKPTPGFQLFYERTEIFQWLSKIEQHASEIYQKASVKLSHDEFFSTFLSQLAEDESWHYRIMNSALSQISAAKNPPVSKIIFDDSTASLLEKPLVILSSQIEKNVVSRQDVVNCIVDAEFSEWNKIFLYAINILKKESKEFQYAAASIQEHEKRIRHFLDLLPADIVFSKKILELPTIWEQSILVVEDDDPLRELVSVILSKIGRIDTAANGLEALEKVKRNYYNVIISAYISHFLACGT
jgi:CheY-like chemotaxis protein